MEHLQKDALSYILQLTNDLYTIVRSRLASPLLRDAAAALIQQLVADDGHLPPRAWLVFAAATKVRAVCARSDKQGDRRAYEAYLLNILELLNTLPSRTEALSIGAGPSMDRHRHWNATDSQLFAKKLTASACCSTIQRITIEQGITTAAADIILQGLPSLQDATLTIYPTTTATSTQPALWHPSADLSNMQGSLLLNASASLAIDLSGISSATNLHQLSITSAGITNLAAISSLTSLQQLSINAADPYAPQTDLDPTPFSTLDNLHLLNMPGCCVDEAGWRTLARLPKLESVMLHMLVIDEHAPSAPALKTMGLPTDDKEALMTLHVQHPEAQLPGCFARQLPQLQQLHIRTYELQELVQALQGHSKLQQMMIDCEGDYQEQHWEGQLFSRLPELESLELTALDMDAGALVMDVSGCSKLGKLHLRFQPRGMGSNQLTKASVAALAAGACSSSLRELVLVGSDKLEPDAAVVLLRGGMVRLRRAELWLCFAERSVIAGNDAKAALRQYMARRGMAGRWEVVGMESFQVKGFDEDVRACVFEVQGV